MTSAEHTKTPSSNSRPSTYARQSHRDEQQPEVSVVMPCLNEAETLAACIAEAQAALKDADIKGEVIVADNGSTDGSQQIALAWGARLIDVPSKGYGNALSGGIEAATGCYVIMGDADASYNFSHVPRIVESLRDGADLVMGNRFRGGIAPGAMPRLHRYLGNPVLTGIGRLLFRCPVGDFHCGLRGFSKAAYRRMELSTAGMEFASEMVIKSTLKGLRVTEVPTVLRPDGRSRPPHLRSWRDGWRHLRFMLLFCPRWLFLFPGLFLFLGGAVFLIALMFEPVYIAGIGFDIQTMLIAGMTALVGYQVILAGVFARGFAAATGLHPQSSILRRLGRWLSLEKGITAGTTLILVGVAVLVFATVDWGTHGFGALNPRSSMRTIVPAVVLLMLGVQTVFGSFFLSLLTLLPVKEKS